MSKKNNLCYNEEPYVHFDEAYFAMNARKPIKAAFINKNISNYKDNIILNLNDKSKISKLTIQNGVFERKTITSLENKSLYIINKPYFDRILNCKNYCLEVAGAIFVLGIGILSSKYRLIFIKYHNKKEKGILIEIGPQMLYDLSNHSLKIFKDSFSLEKDNLIIFLKEVINENFNNLLMCNNYNLSINNKNGSIECKFYYSN